MESVKKELTQVFNKISEDDEGYHQNLKIANIKDLYLDLEME